MWSLADEDKENRHLVEVYDEIYRYACQPAHFGDLTGFTIKAQFGRIGEKTEDDYAWVFTALQYGVRTVLYVLDGILEHQDALPAGAEKVFIKQRFSKLDEAYKLI